MLFILSPTHAWAKNVIIITEEHTDRFDLNDYMEFHDPGVQQSDINAVIQLNAQDWQSIKSLSPSLIFSNHHSMWFRIILENKSEKLQSLALSNNNPLSNIASIYICKNFEKNSCERKERAKDNQENTLLEIEPNTIQIINIEISGLNSAFPSVTLEKIETYNIKRYNQKLVSEIINGAILGLTIYALLLAIKTRQSMYYSYCLLGFFNLATVFIHQRFFISYTNFLNNELRADLSIIIPLFITASLAQFVRDFAETKNNNTTIDLFLKIYMTFAIVIAMGFLIGVSTAITLPPFIVASIIATTCMYYLCFVSQSHTRLSMAMLAIGISMPMLSGIITLSMAMRIITAEMEYMRIMQVFDVIEMMMFSMAMLNSVKHLENQQTRQAGLALEANTISEAHNRLLAHLNHELRTPLNGILGAAEILVHKSHPRDRHIFSMICHTALPLKHLIDEMVDISSISENKKHLRSIRFDLQSLLQECMDVFLPVANDKHIRLFFTVERDTANDVTGDPNRLRQILLNLIGNACKFTSNGEVGLHVKKRSALEDNKCLYYFEVTDSGMGISKADEQKLFGIFETSTSAINPKGAGLGLSIVRELSELLGGSCGYANNAASGSIFWFTAALEPHQKVNRKTHRVFENLDILIADKSESICSQICQQISDAAKTTKTIQTCENLSEEIEKGKYDILITQKELLSEDIIKLSQDMNLFIASYVDNNEINNFELSTKYKTEEEIIRKISIEAFLLQIAEFIINNSNLVSKKTTPINSIERKFILAAEDIPANQHIISEIIQSLGYNAVICSNGKQAVDLYTRYLLDGKPFEAIIMDCEMPLMDGFDATRIIRKYEQEHGIKPTFIMALTAHTEAAYRQRSEQSGMDSYLTKPVTTEKILQTLVDAGKK
jgi:signal transduction histidine kinase/CheY-like chemotaxis protein